MAVIQQLKLAAFALLIGLVVTLLLAVTSDYASGSDYTVTRSTAIESQRPIWLLVTEAGLGVLNDDTRTNRSRLWSGAEIESSILRIDGRPSPGIGGMVRAAWRLVGFVVWDEAGRIERTTTLSVHGHVVHVYDRVSNGSVRVRVVVGPPLGDPRVRFAVLDVEVMEHGTVFLRRPMAAGAAVSTIRLSCSAIIDLPGRCRLVRRIAQRVAQREAGAELGMRVLRLSELGRNAVAVGRGQMDEIVNRFLERVCR